ncbi:type II secretion system F family protein [Peptoniphilus sp. oral taxon 386]|uniref:type II secretion system F family protein n=1 Tax=Peptoniphilus sp. oral taxon 386 TaxID=652713 RepID=UPI0001DA9BBC|nr:type II secretion system F family protein [Peptoniphilus sp. oral taxon 386]EFI42366.1 bacterial type II secretion system domain protein F [Peptoniphilus sp. oral taxon 386 str. F0131]
MIFKYKALDFKDNLIEDRLEANSEKEAISILRSRNLRPIKIVEINKINVDIVLKRRTFNNEDLHILLYQLYVLVNAKNTIPSAFRVLLKSYSGKKNKILKKVYQDLLSAKPLSDALKESGEFPNLVVNMIGVGENSSNMILILKNLSEYYLNKVKLDKKIRNALSYPILLFVVTFFIVNFLMLNILPTFAEVFKNSGAELPYITQILINISTFINKNIIIIILNFLIAILLLEIFFKTYRGRYTLDKIKLKNKFYKTIIVKRFVNMLNYLISSKATMSNSLEIIIDSTENFVVKEHIKNAIRDLYDGISLSDSLRNTGLFSEAALSMLNIGEETSELDNILRALDDYYEHEIYFKSQKYVSLVEPIIILVLSIFVGFIVISIAMPMFDLVNRI